VESIASRGEMLIEILNYSGFIGGDRVSYPQCSGQLEGGALILHGLYNVPELFGVCVAGSKFLLDCLCILVSNFSKKLHLTMADRCKCRTPQDVFVLVKGSQVWREPRAISGPGSKFLEWGMLI
jgi:hypothetical protein